MEKEDFDWNTGHANPGAKQPIGHYKQLVRPQITAVGCTVISKCRVEGGWRTFVVCHYDFGNIGVLPYERNVAGEPSEIFSGYMFISRKRVQIVLMDSTVVNRAYVQDDFLWKPPK